ncbi:hypothetical protein, partial [Klebsiella pneumoniae]|uniref:hypothetical protein n=1 Tax=Klebsiella pneumoniae TaxID=573 RepID=UPI001CA4633B
LSDRQLACALQSGDELVYCSDVHAAHHSIIMQMPQVIAPNATRPIAFIAAANQRSVYLL